MVQGTSILVAAPKSELDKLRLDIAGSGLARSGKVGYEIFDKNQFGMTDFTEQVNLQRALEGELARHHLQPFRNQPGARSPRSSEGFPFRRKEGRSQGERGGPA